MVNLVTIPCSMGEGYEPAWIRRENQMKLRQLDPHEVEEATLQAEEDVGERISSDSDNGRVGEDEFV